MAEAVSVLRDGRTEPASSISKKWDERIEQGKKDRARFEPVWQMSAAFAAGKQHLKWSRRQRRLVLPDMPKGRERYTADAIMQYRLTAVGDMSHDDDRPTVAFRKEDIEGEEYAKVANDATGYGWDYEWDADAVLMDLRFKLVDLGTAAVRCRLDPTAGPMRQRVPLGADGQVIVDGPEYASLKQGGKLSDGSLPKFKAQHEGRTRWELGGPFNLLVPPGLEHERDFPWEIWVRPYPIDKLVEEYGTVSDGLVEDPLAAIHMLGAKELGDLQGSDPDGDTGQPGKLDGQVLVFTCFERPTGRNPEGEMVILAGAKEKRPLAAPRPLPYRAPDGTPRSGITYFRYVPVTGRWWGRSLVEGLKDPQRMINKRRGQISDTYDKGQPKVYGEDGSLPEEVSGEPVAYIPVKAGAPLPTVFAGISPTQGMYQEIDSLRTDMEHASTIRAVSLGENPQNVVTYSQLALLRQNDQLKLVPILKSFRGGVIHLVEDSLYDVKRYWGREKTITLEGESEGMLASAVFDATKLPDFYKVELPKGAAKPRDQAAMLQLISDVAQYSLGAHQPLPVSWFARSLEEGKLEPIPEGPTDDQAEKAQVENVMLARGQSPAVAYYDPPLVHIPIHRSFQIQAELSGRPELGQLAEQHIQQHLQMEQVKAMQAQPGVPGAPGAPPSSPQGPPGQPPPGGPPGPAAAPQGAWGPVAPQGAWGPVAPAPLG